MAGDVLGCAVHSDVRPQIQWPQQIGGEKGVVCYQQQVILLADMGQGRYVSEFSAAGW
jgi:hypothetical protein